MSTSHVLTVYDEYWNKIPIPAIRGKTGAAIVSTTFIGEDMYGNYQYLQKFDNGYLNIFTAPRGTTEKILKGEQLQIEPTQRQLTEALQKLWRKLGGTVLALLVCLQLNADVTRSTEWRDVPATNTVGSILDLGAAAIATNAVNGITTNGIPVSLDAARIAHLVFPTGGGSADLTPAFEYTTAVSNKLEAAKQDVISDLTEIRSGAAAGSTAYQKTSSGIPKSDLSSSVRTSLGKADTALQSYTETDPKWTSEKSSYLTTLTASLLYQTKGDYVTKTVTNDLAATVRSHVGSRSNPHGVTAAQAGARSNTWVPSWSQVTGKPTFATVATSGSYDDLSDKPTVPTNYLVSATVVGGDTLVISNSDDDVTYAAFYGKTSGRQDHAAITNLQAYLGGQNVRVSVTNYYAASSGALPRLRIEENVSNVWTVVWDENDKFEGFRTNTLNGVSAMTNNLIGYVDSTKAPKAWGTYTSAGADAPPNTVWHTAGKTVFGGGTEFKCVTTANGVFGALCNVGGVVYAQGNPGTFRFETEDFRYFFGMHVKDSYLIGCATDGLTATTVGGNTTVQLSYDITMSGKPVLYYRPTMEHFASNHWEQLNDSTGTPIPGASVVANWDMSPPAGKEMCYINCGTNKCAFFTAYVEMPGANSFETNLEADFQAGILATNQVLHKKQAIEPYIDDALGTVKWRVKP